MSENSSSRDLEGDEPYFEKGPGTKYEYFCSDCLYTTHPWSVHTRHFVLG